MDVEHEVIKPSGYAVEMRDIILKHKESQEEKSDDDGDNKHATRKVLRAKVVDNADGTDKRVNITIVHQRRHKRSEEWKDIDSFRLSQLKGGEEAKLHLHADETFDLLENLLDLYAISRSGEPSNERRVYLVRRGDEEYPLFADQNIINFLAEGGDELWQKIVDAKPNMSLALALYCLHMVRQQRVAEFEQHLTAGDWIEADWQKFFKENPWIFGHGLAYHILDTIQPQVSYGGQNFTGSGEQRGDFLLATRAEIRFTVLVEIKRPDTPLLQPKPYRNNAFSVSDDLAGGVAQLQANSETWVIERSRQQDTRDQLEERSIYTHEPKCILVIGNTARFGKMRSQWASFERFRRNLGNPEILTFDELLERARFLVREDIATETMEGSSI